MIELDYIRSSMYGTHSICPQKFFLSYILGWQEPSGKGADRGTIFHKVMEILAKIKLARQNNKRKIYDEIVGKYPTNPQKLDLNFIIDAVFNYYAKANNHHIWDEEDHKTIIKWVDKAVKFDNGTFDPLNQTIVEAEKHFDLLIEELNGVRLCGTIDLLVQEKDILHIIDYKTGKRVNWATGETKEYEDFLKDFQLNLYHLAIRKLFPELETILITIYYINCGGPYTIALDKSDLPQTIENINKFYNTITTEKPKIRKGFWCGFCDYSKSTFEDTDILPIINNGQHKFHFTKRGEPCKKCDQTAYVLTHRDIDVTMKHMSNKTFDNTSYQSPGEI